MPGAPEARKMSQPPGRNAAHCPAWPLQPQRCSASRCAGRACGAPLTLETSASPAGLTARARPKARPGSARRTSATDRAPTVSREAVLAAVTTAADCLTIKVGTITRAYGHSPSLLTALAPSY